MDVAADDRRELRLFPLKGCGAAAGCCLRTTVKATAGGGDALWLLGNALRQSAHHAGYHDGRALPPGSRTPTLSLPEGETRVLWVNGEPGERFTLE